MQLRPLNLPLAPDREIQAVLGVPRTAAKRAVLVLAHGANNTMDHPLLVGLQEKLARQGLVTVRFNFPYAQEGRKRPDPEAALEGVFRLVVEYVADLEEFKGLEMFVGGKSMGARLAAQIVAQDVGAAGLVFLGYPLHAPGKPEVLRDAPLYQLPCPVLFVEGARDPFCHLGRLGEVLGRLRVRSNLHVMPGLGHSYETAAGRDLAPEVLEEVSRVILAWFDSL